MIAIDTNLLIYAHRGGVPEHREARAAIEQAANSGRGWGIASPSGCLSRTRRHAFGAPVRALLID
jgi:hypothetical protein